MGSLGAGKPAAEDAQSSHSRSRRHIQAGSDINILSFRKEIQCMKKGEVARGCFLTGNGQEKVLQLSYKPLTYNAALGCPH